MVIVGWLRRAVILGAKFDECRACHAAGPHLLYRKTHWFTLFWIPVFLLWISHGVMCAACGDEEGISMLRMRRALRSGRLPLGRQRAAFEAAFRDNAGGVEPGDWEAFNLEPTATEPEVRARWRDMEKALHPSAGGDALVYVAFQAAYRRLLRATQYIVTSKPDPAEVFDPVVSNPRRGFFDFYSTKLWPAALVLVVAVTAFGAITRTPSGPGSTSPAGALTTPTPARGTAHTCWYTDDAINGCEDDTSSSMLFGTRTGTKTICWFVEPLLDGQSARCR